MKPSKFSDEELNRLAVEEILKETKLASVRAEQYGAIGWQNRGSYLNKQFILNTMKRTTDFNNYINGKRRRPAATCLNAASDRNNVKAENLHADKKNNKHYSKPSTSKRIWNAETQSPQINTENKSTTKQDKVSTVFKKDKVNPIKKCNAI